MAVARGRLTPDRPTGEALIAALPSAVVVLDDSGRIDSINAAAEVMLNASSQHLRHKPLGVVLQLPPACVAGLKNELEFSAYDCRIATSRGMTLDVDVHAAPLGGHAAWRVLTLHPSAGSQGRSRRLDRRETGRSAYGAAAMLAHEIKNPLSGIRGAAQLLDAHTDSKGADLTQLIRDEVDRVVGLIDRMEQFTDRRPLECRAENIYPILDHARAVFASGHGDRAHVVDAFDPSLPPVLVNRDALIQILLNVLKNAAEAVPEGERGTITLATAYRPGVSIATPEGRRSLPIELSIADDGPGPSDEIVDYLFEPFVSSKASGRGLGLALVDKLVRDQGGIVQFSRERDPARSVFRLLLPRAD